DQPAEIPAGRAQGNPQEFGHLLGLNRPRIHAGLSHRVQELTQYLCFPGLRLTKCHRPLSGTVTRDPHDHALRTDHDCRPTLRRGRHSCGSLGIADGLRRGPARPDSDFRVEAEGFSKSPHIGIVERSSVAARSEPIEAHTRTPVSSSGSTNASILLPSRSSSCMRSSLSWVNDEFVYAFRRGASASGTRTIRNTVRSWLREAPPPTKSAVPSAARRTRTSGRSIKTGTPASRNFSSTAG